jgi:predicted RNase H-like HicB family nuclease
LKRNTERALVVEMQGNEQVFNILVEKDEDGFYIATVVELPGCHTQAKTLDVLNRRIKEAIEGFLQVSKPEYRPQFVGVQQLKLRISQ